MIQYYHHHKSNQQIIFMISSNDTINDIIKIIFIIDINNCC